MTIVLVLATIAARAAPEAEPSRRVAVVVGANAGFSGGPPLRYAHSDAQRMADALQDVGGFEAPETHLLFDPRPDEVLALLDAELARAGDRETMLVFYYSGHADDGALFPHGERLPLEALRSRLDDERAAVRVGIIDACRGGRWTGTKGLVPEAPFEVPLEMTLASTGSVLISASSGSQSAYETETIGGSLFTHHLVTGLRGGADGGGDGAVTLTEAFEYATAGTVRDALLYAGSEQHPSFNLNLRGRQELVLSRVARGDSVVVLQQDEGPLELIDLASGVLVLTLPKGPRTTRLALVPGTYLVRRRDPDGQSATEFRLAPDQSLLVAEDQLERVGILGLRQKGSDVREPIPLVLPRGRVETSGQLGAALAPPSSGAAANVVLGTSPVQTAPGLRVDVEAGGALGISDRVNFVFPAVLKVGIGSERRVALWGGLRSIGMFSQLPEGADRLTWQLASSVGTGIDVRVPVRSLPFTTMSLAAGLTAGSWASEPRAGYDRLRVDGYAGALFAVKRLRWNVMAGAGVELRPDGEPSVTLSIGSMATPGGVRTPLLSLDVDDDLGIALDLYLGAQLDRRTGDVEELMMFGLSMYPPFTFPGLGARR